MRYKKITFNNVAHEFCSLGDDSHELGNINDGGCS